MMKYVLSQNLEVWLMCSQGEHNQIGVLCMKDKVSLRTHSPRVDTYQTVNHMARVGVIFRIAPLASDPVHDFVLSFSWNGSVGDDDLQLLAGRIAHW